MRKLAIILLLILIAAAAVIDFIGFVAVVRADGPTRFEQLLWERTHDEADAVRGFEVWHDKQSGQEFICVVASSTYASRDKVSCFPSGRSWR